MANLAQISLNKQKINLWPKLLGMQNLDLDRGSEGGLQCGEWDGFPLNGHQG